MKMKVLRLTLVLMFVFVAGAMASAQCTPDDGNNTAADADPIGYTDAVTDWVCPDDPFDYYVLQIPEGAEVSGRIIFSSPQRSTVLRIEHSESGRRVVDDVFTTEERREYRFPIAPGSIASGTYIARAFFWSEAAFDHEYTLTLELTVAGESECVPDDSNSRETAWDIAFRTTVSDWVCPADPVDMWHFTVAADDEYGGTVSLTAGTGELYIYLMDSGGAKLADASTTAGALEYKLSDHGLTLAPGDYYVGVSLASSGDYGSSYSLTLKKPYIFVEVGPREGLELEKRQPQEWHVMPELAPADLWARITIDTLYCWDESDVDEGSTADEPYAKVIAYASHESPTTWSTGSPQKFSDVDKGENRAFTSAQRIVYQGEVPSGAAIGFDVELWEDDTVSNDDFVAKASVRVSYDDLRNWLQVAPHQSEQTYLDGGSEGQYWLRWHVDLDRLASSNFMAKFTNWDAFAVGYLGPGLGEELILTVIDEDAPGNDGKYYVRNALGFLLRSFDAWYTSYDQVACGDTNGDGFDEIVVASDDHGGMVLIYDGDGEMMFSFTAPVTHYDGLALADVDGNGTCEILLAKDDNDTVYTYDAMGNKIREMRVEWNFKGIRYTNSTTRHDAFLVGNVLGDDKPEIVLIQNESYGNGIPHIYAADNVSGVEVITPIHFTQYVWQGVATSVGKYTNYDGSCLADIMGDSRMELLIATDDGDGYDGYKIKVFDLENKTVEDIRHWPLFTKYDGFAAGDVLGVGKDQILIASDQDDRVYISR